MNYINGLNYSEGHVASPINLCTQPYINIGRRKKAVANLVLFPRATKFTYKDKILGRGFILINGKSVCKFFNDDFFKIQPLLRQLMFFQELSLNDNINYRKYSAWIIDVKIRVTVKGGGKQSQIRAICLALACAYVTIRVIRLYIVYLRVAGGSVHHKNIRLISAYTPLTKKVILQPDTLFHYIPSLTRDSRKKERRKYRLKKARKASQFSKRLAIF